MDNFMNKLSQRISAQDTIKANFMADTAEKEVLKKQLAEYDAVLQSVRNLYLKQEENSEVFAQLAAKLEGMGGDTSEKQTLLKEIKDYITFNNPMDKAGAYSIQGIASSFVEKIDGDYNNVVGLPVGRLYQEAKNNCGLE